jgi:hypothetical protein
MCLKVLTAVGISEPALQLINGVKDCYSVNAYIRRNCNTPHGDPRSATSDDNCSKIEVGGVRPSWCQPFLRDFICRKISIYDIRTSHKRDVSSLYDSRSTARSVSCQGSTGPTKDATHAAFPIQNLEDIQHTLVLLPGALTLDLQEHLGALDGCSDKGCWNGREETCKGKLGDAESG